MITEAEITKTLICLTWNCENIKTNIYCLRDTLDTVAADLVFLSEPNIFQSDLDSILSHVKGKYLLFLNSEDLFDPELPMIQTRTVGGTMVLWASWLDPYVTVIPPSASSHTIIVLRIPGHQVTVHVCIYLPTSGREQDFISEIASLGVRLTEIMEQYRTAALFIRGDSNVNKNNKNRCLLLSKVLEQFSLSLVSTNHPTYHHFTGHGLYDSDIDILAHSNHQGVSEHVIDILCIKDHPTMLSHHDMIVSKCTIPASPSRDTMRSDLISAPRLVNTRQKIIWNPETIPLYEESVGPILSSLRETWLHPSSPASISVLLNLTNHVLSQAASSSHKSVSLAAKPNVRPARTPRLIRLAARRLRKAHRNMRRCRNTDLLTQNKAAYISAQKSYKRAVRSVRLQENVNRDNRLVTILTDNPSSLFSYIKSSKNTTSNIEKLCVGDKTYLGDRVGDGFYDAMTAVKFCNFDELLEDRDISEQFSNYENIMKLCEDKIALPTITLDTAEKLLGRLRKNVKDFFSITALHYINAGNEGLEHFHALFNAVVTNVNNASIEELNVAHGIILWKGHKKDKTCGRSYRTISTCPFLSKALDLYLRDMYQERWDKCQASTQYQGAGSSHDMASLLVTEVIQHSLYATNQPVYILALDAQSAFDRCLRQILVCELYRAGVRDAALTMIDNRLANRTTVYEWNRELLGPAPDTTGFEQGGINSSDYYKLYNNIQLETAQLSELGVDLGPVVVSAIGQADDVVLCSNNIDNLRLLVTLTENYCKRYNVKLVPTKTKLLGYACPNKKHLLDLAKVVNPITVAGEPVKFVEEAPHVGVVRSTSGNLPHIMDRISSHKRGMNFVLSAGLSRGQSGNPAASLRVHQLYGTPKLFSGLATLVLSKAEIKIIDSHYQKTIQNLQRLHDKTPRCFVFLLAGCIPGEAVLHQRQLTLFMQICHLPLDPLHTHARHVLMCARPSYRSWFQQIYQLCILYSLDHPLLLLDSPPTKLSFKFLIKQKIIAHWEDKLKDEASRLPSLHYFLASRCTLSYPHSIWRAASHHSSFENRKSSILARMMSGRFKSEYLTRHWSSNKEGFCQAEMCHRAGTRGDLEHLLVHCPGLATVRVKLWEMFYDHSVQFPAFLDFLLKLEKSPPEYLMQFLLDPEAFPEVIEMWELFGPLFMEHVYYLTRTYTYCVYREKQIMLGVWTRATHVSKKNQKDKKENISYKTHSSLSGNIVAGRLDDLHDLPGVHELHHQALRVVHNHHPDQPSILSEKSSAVRSHLAFPVESGHHTATQVTNSDISGHGGLTDCDQPVHSCCSGGVGNDVRAMLLQNSDNRPGHKMSLKIKSKSKYLSNKSCNKGGKASLGVAYLRAGGSCCPTGS